jgi:peptidoglycan hydrolase CwlO-like protein
MQISDIAPFLVAIATGLSSTAAWQFYTNRALASDKKAQEEREQFNLYQDNLRERVAILESKLEEAYKDREELQDRILKLAEATAAMRVEIDFLRKENEGLRNRLKTDENNTVL